MNHNASYLYIRGGILILPVFALCKSQLFAHCLLMDPIWNEGEQKDFLQRVKYHPNELFKAYEKSD